MLDYVSPRSSATRYLPRINFSAISLALASTGLKVCWSIGPDFEQKTSFIISYKYSKLLSSTKICPPSKVNTMARGVNIILYFGKIKESKV
ncbi:MAG: hypothetical protein J6V44_07980 [Methanobrevibacter sp.]|nr:hypothetical protein [Methanobrevibacter sp.]